MNIFINLKELKHEVRRDSKDEIGELYFAFNRLRARVVKLVKMPGGKRGSN
jgi:HAMP domain-containing protein